MHSPASRRRGGIFDLWTSLMVLSLEHSRTTGRSIAPAAALASGGLCQLFELGLVAFDGVDDPMGCPSAVHHAWRPRSRSGWAEVIRQVEAWLAGGVPAMDRGALAEIWSQLAEADSVEYAGACAQSHPRLEEITDGVRKVFRRTKNELSIDQRRYACAIAIGGIGRNGECSGPADFCEVLAEQALRVGTDDRLVRPCAAPRLGPASSMELVFNTRFARLGLAYYTAPVGLDALCRVARVHRR
jgi:hypothetical protein